MWISLVSRYLLEVIVFSFRYNELCEIHLNILFWNSSKDSFISYSWLMKSDLQDKITFLKTCLSKQLWEQSMYKTNQHTELQDASEDGGRG